MLRPSGSKRGLALWELSSTHKRQKFCLSAFSRSRMHQIRNLLLFDYIYQFQYRFISPPVKFPFNKGPLLKSVHVLSTFEWDAFLKVPRLQLPNGFGAYSYVGNRYVCILPPTPIPSPSNQSIDTILWTWAELGLRICLRISEARRFHTKIDMTTIRVVCTTLHCCHA